VQNNQAYFVLPANATTNERRSVVFVAMFVFLLIQKLDTLTSASQSRVTLFLTYRQVPHVRKWIAVMGKIQSDLNCDQLNHLLKPSF